jgi:endonuclease/exonuclease/phosphatase (EEP) superfamily protein YafD
MWVSFRFLTWLAAVGGGAVCAGLAIAGQGGRWSQNLDLINHAAPMWLAGGLAAVALSWIVARGWARWLGVGIGSIAALAAGLQTVPVWVERAATPIRASAIPASAPRIRVIQFSFYHSNPNAGGAVDWLLAQQPDIIVLEEGEGLRGEARRRLLAAYPYRSAYRDMILSRLPLLDQGRFEAEPRPTSMYFNGGYAVVQGPAGPFTVVGIHMTWPWPTRFQVRQRREFSRYIATLPQDSTVVAGDLNSTPWSFALAGLEQDMGLNRLTHGQMTFPARKYVGAGLENRARELPGVFAFAPIDHIFAGAGWQPVRVWRGPRLGSDHFPVVADLAWIG